MFEAPEDVPEPTRKQKPKAELLLLLCFPVNRTMITIVFAI